VAACVVVKATGQAHVDQPQPGLRSTVISIIGLRYVRHNTLECASQFQALLIAIKQTEGLSQCGEHGECLCRKSEYNIGEANFTGAIRELEIAISCGGINRAAARSHNSSPTKLESMAGVSF
jgi:hypothetical protein